MSYTAQSTEKSKPVEKYNLINAYVSKILYLIPYLHFNNVSLVEKQALDVGIKAIWYTKAILI